MKKIIKSKTYNTETSKKVCSYVVNDWTHELYQSKSGEYFTYIYNEEYISHWMEKHINLEKLMKREDFTRETLRLLTESEVKHMLERSGSVTQDKKETVLTELEDYFSKDGVFSLSVTGKCGFVNFDFGSWELTVDIDDEHWVKMTSKGKTVFDEYDFDEMSWIKCRRGDMIREEYLKGRFGKC